MFRAGEGPSGCWIDATPEDTPGLGRLISHSRGSAANLVAVPEKFKALRDSDTYIAFYAKKNIFPGLN